MRLKMQVGRLFPRLLLPFPFTNPLLSQTKSHTTTVHANTHAFLYKTYVHPYKHTYRNTNTHTYYKVIRKLCFFFTIHCNPSLAYIAAVKTFKALNAMRVYSHSFWLVIFLTTNSSRVLARERWQTFENSREKSTIFNEHPVPASSCTQSKSNLFCTESI